MRDRSGIPHITAANQDDLFFAQGFVQAQDRLFQIDLWRRSAHGRLSEVLGANFIERDAATRRVQYRGDPEPEWASYGPDTQAIATAFTRGINAWVDQALEQLPEEFALAGWKPEHWEPADLLNRTDAFVAGADAADEVFRAEAASALGTVRTDLLFPPRDGGRTLVDRGVDLSAVNSVLSDILRRVGAPPVFSGLAAPLAGTARVDTNSDGRAELQSGATGRSGGHAWTISHIDGPGRSSLVAGDLYRPLSSPSLRYLVHLTAPGWNVIGATLPWLPGVAIGHNDDIAWSFIPSGADVQDLYVEKVNPQNPRQVEYRGAWADLHVEPDSVGVKGRVQPFDFERLYTRNGVVVGLDRERQIAYTLRWTGSEPGTAGELAALAIDRANSWSGFRVALSRWKLPAAEFVYGDRAGHIGRQFAGLTPRRRPGAGHVPAAGASGAGEWNGWIPAAELASTADPRSGFLVLANGNAPQGNRLAGALTAMVAIDVEATKRLQHDVGSWISGQITPLLRQLHAGEPAVEAARSRLVAFDGKLVGGDVSALYAAWETAVRRMLVEQRVPSFLRSDALARLTDIVTPLTRPTSAWFDGDPVAARDQLLLDALAAVVKETGGKGGAETWNRDHSMTFVHPLGVSARARQRFNVGPFVMPGYADSVFAVTPSTGPAMQVIFATGDWDRSAGMNAPGQSGAAASPHFADLAKIWAGGGYVPLPFSESAVQASSESVLVLTPKQ